MAAQGSTQPKAAPSLPARLYPINDIATENGMVAGTITSTIEGKARGAFMTCEYQMSSLARGAS